MEVPDTNTDMDTSSTYTVVDVPQLPDEILLKILSSPLITVQDLGRVTRTCSRLRNIVDTNCLWRLKFKQHWPELWEQIIQASIHDWRDEVKQLMTFLKKVQDFVSGLSRQLYHCVHLTTRIYAEVDALVVSSRHGLLYVNAALRQIIENGPQYENMTEKYYALKVKGHVHQTVCKQEWERFLSRSPYEQPLEIGAILIARWFQAHNNIRTLHVTKQIDGLTEECRAKLAVVHPDHPVLLKPMFSPHQFLFESEWPLVECHQIFKCVNHVLFSQVKFCGNTGDYYNLKNSLINEVLDSKKGIPITLSILYTAICHRLGIPLEPVNYPSHFEMRWKKPRLEEYEYIDAFNKGRRLTGEELLREMPMQLSPDQNLLESCTAMHVFQRMIRNIMNVAQMQAHVSDHMELFCSATELMSLLSPGDRSVQELLLRIYYTLEIHYDRIIAGCRHLLKQGSSKILEEMLADCERILAGQSNTPKPITSKERAKEIMYTTGLVMRHKKYHYECVIYGWDKTCRMTIDWVHKMGVQNLVHQTEQPFYNVLVYDGSHRYAAQENLEVASDPEPVTHTDVGKYFKTFTGKYYVPNSELQEEYPEDEAVRSEILKAQGWL